jgi:hypothetical protein
VSVTNDQVKFPNQCSKTQEDYKSNRASYLDFVLRVLSQENLAKYRVLGVCLLSRSWLVLYNIDWH